MLVSRQIPALFNGVSQQPATLRLPSQAEEQINCYGTVADGLRKRPPFEHVAQMTTDDISSAFIHTINRDVSERYVVVVTDGGLQVFDALTGDEKTVNTAITTNYLDVVGGGSAKDSFALVTIADYTFLVNKTVTVATKAAPTADPPNYADWYYPPSWGDIPPVGYYWNYGSSYTYRGVKQTFSDLPKTASSNDVWKVAGYDEDNFGAYYVIRTNGVWEETYGPTTDDDITLDEATMPHALVRESDGTFTLTQFAWSPRKVGDDDTNPPPTFVGKTLQDVFYYKNRLGFVCDENVIFSGASDFGNFWRNTVVDLLDSDVVDVAVSSAKVSLLKYAVPFNSGLMLFADQTQFALNVDQLLTPTSVSIDTVTNFEMSTAVRPVGVGRDVYFVTETGNYSRVREYYVQENDNSSDAADITAHIPRYLPKQIFRLAGNANEDVLFAVSNATGEKNRVYVYKFFWNEDGKVQSAWNYWEMDDNGEILSIDILENELFALVKRGDGTYLERADVQDGATTGNTDYQILLDRLSVDTTPSYLSGTDKTRVALDYPVVSAQEKAAFRIVRGTGHDTEVSLVDPSTYVWIDNSTVELPGDETDGDLVYGYSYEMRFTFSEQFMMNGDKAITTGRLMLRTFVLYFTDTAFFKTEVAPYGNDPLVEEVVPSALSSFTGKTLGEASLIVGSPVFHTGEYAFQIYGDSSVASVSLVNDSHVQSKFQSAEWEGFYHNRARSV